MAVDEQLDDSTMALLRLDEEVLDDNVLILLYDLFLDARYRGGLRQPEGAQLPVRFLHHNL